MRVPYETMLAEFERVLKKYGFSADRAHDAAQTDAIVDAIAADVASSRPFTEGSTAAGLARKWHLQFHLFKPSIKCTSTLTIHGRDLDNCDLL